MQVLLYIVEAKCRDSEEFLPPEVPSKPDSLCNNGVGASTETAEVCERNVSLDFSREVNFFLPQVVQKDHFSDLFCWS